MNAELVSTPDGYARMLDDCLTDLHSLAARPWRQDWQRTGHVYAQLGPRPANADLPIGTFSSSALAAEAVRCHNQAHGYT